MWQDFFLGNAHFVLNLFAALVFFAIFWLYFDAFLARKNKKEIGKLIGFFLLTLSFLVHAVHPQTALGETLLEQSGIYGLFPLLRIGGYLFLLLGVILDPLQKKPKVLLTQPVSAVLAIPLLSEALVSQSAIIYPVLAGACGFLYLRRATSGLENHLKPVALGLYLLAFSELISLHELLSQTSSIDVYLLVRPLGVLWFVQHGLLLMSLFVLGRWVYYYLLKRLQTQLFMLFTTTILVIFLLTTTVFTVLLLANIEDETKRQLEIDAKVLQYALESKKAEVLSDAQVLASDDAVIAALEEKNRLLLAKSATEFLLTKKQNFLVILDENGEVLARGEETERIGDSLSNDPFIKRVLLGEPRVTLLTHEGAHAPLVSVQAASPVRTGGQKQEGKIIGAVILGTVVDTPFLDGVKKATGLEASLWADNILSATTIIAKNQKSSFVGIKEENKNVKSVVFEKGKPYTSSVTFLNTPYFASYLPLFDSENTAIGMLSVAKEQVAILQAASRSIALTFLTTVVLMICSVIPAFFVSRYLANQL